MTNEELESQLSAMFDDELPEPECELLARRLARDEALKARWGRYATIGAVLRMERGVRTHSGLVRAVSVAVAAEPSVLATARARELVRPAVRRWWQPVAGAAVAAGVAFASIVWMRSEAPGAPGAPEVAQVQPAPAAAVARSTAPDSYVVPTVDPTATGSTPPFIPPAELADYVVAHSEFSAPLLRHSALSSLVTADPGTGNAASAPTGGDNDQQK
ncbi:MAG TPA: sigma-E factor negative regulatory protein [Steroidobacteraceae bacterium]|nr:sigma-E factor negative regulatory protein [Steroidobacteraceae bacterium]